MIGILGWIIIGLFAGWIASMVLSRHHGLFLNLIIGLVGSVLGGWLAQHVLHFYAFGFVSHFVVALAGSVVLLLIVGLVSRPR